MTDTDEFRKRCLMKCREELLRKESKDETDPMDMIIRTVFREPGSDEIDEDILDMIILRIFYMTRGNLGILDPLQEDDEVNEIMVNGKDNIFYEKGGRVHRYPLTFDSSEDLEEVMRNIAGRVHREINELNPIVDARLPDGSRVNGVYSNVAVNGPILTIRKFNDRYMTMDDLVSNGTMDREQAEFLEALVRCGYNLFISGGTSSGKTTLLNALSASIPKEERVIVIEDSMELKLNHIENIVHMECRNANSQGKGLVTMSDLIRASLRMRPDRIIVGEVRGAEVQDMIQAMNTGHPGSMSTGHGNSCEGMLKRLESMYLMAVPLGIDAIREQIAEGIDIMVHVERVREGTRRIMEIKEIVGYEKSSFILNDLMDPAGPGLKNISRSFTGGDEYAEILRRGPFSRDNGGIHIL